MGALVPTQQPVTCRLERFDEHTARHPPDDHLPRPAHHVGHPTQDGVDDLNAGAVGLEQLVGLAGGVSR